MQLHVSLSHFKLLRGGGSISLSKASEMHHQNLCSLNEFGQSNFIFAIILQFLIICLPFSAQQDAAAYKHQLAKRQQALDQNDLDFRARIVHIEAQLQRAQDTLDGKNTAIQRLEELLEEAGKRKRMVDDENQQLLEDVGRKEHQRQVIIMKYIILTLIALRLIPDLNRNMTLNIHFTE